MRTIKSLFFLLLCLQIIIVQAQDIPIQKPADKPKVIDKNIKVKTHTIDKKTLTLAMADLVIIDLQILNSGSIINGNKSFTIQATIKNIGNVDASNFTISSEVKANNSPHFIRTNHFKIVSLAKGESRIFQQVIFVPIALISDLPGILRFFIDSGGTQEFPKSYMDVSESNELNNSSNELSFGGSYMPYIASVHPEKLVNRIIIGGSETASNQSVYITGSGFGNNTNNQYGLVLIQGNTIRQLNHTNWGGIIYFSIPKEVETGQYSIAIVDKNNNSLMSNPFPVSIYHEARVLWSELIATWKLFSEAFSIQINNFGGDNSYKNTSTVSILGMSDTLDVPQISFHVNSIGDYRYYINDFNSLPSGIILSKLSQGNEYVLSDEMLRMEVSFESEGVEAKGYFKSIAAGAGWSDWGAPDIDFDNAKLGFTIIFSYQNGHLDYTIPNGLLYFIADIDAHDSGADFFMDTFMGKWDDDVKEKVRNSVQSAISNPQTKESICSSFMQAVYLLSKGLGQNSTIDHIEFDKGIVVTFQ